MTYEFLSKSGFYLNESVVISPKQYRDMDILESAIDALREGTDSNFVIKSSTSYAYSLVQELLDNVKNMLLELVQQVLKVLNNLYTNSIKLLEKYKDILIERYHKIEDVIIHDTYSYPDTNYPVIIKSSAVDSGIKALERMAVEDGAPAGQIADEIDTMLFDFGYHVTGDPIDLYNIVESTKKNITKKTRGRPVHTIVTVDTIREYSKTINHYKQDRDEILKAKKDILDQYTALKVSYKKLTSPELQQRSVEEMRRSVRYTVAPDKENFMAQEYTRYANVNTEMLRLFNGFIAIYRAAFDTKLNLMLDKYNDRKEFITKLFTATGIFAAINTKNAKDPIKIDTRKQK